MTIALWPIERDVLKSATGLTDQQIDAALAEMTDAEKIADVAKVAWPHVMSLIADVTPIIPNISRVIPVIVSILHTLNQKDPTQ